MGRSRNAARAAGAAALAFLFVAAAVFAGVSQVRLKLPLKPRLPLRGNEKLALAPFILVTEAEKDKDREWADRVLAVLSEYNSGRTPTAEAGDP